MERQTKKILSLLLSIVLICGMLAGCGGGGQDKAANVTVFSFIDDRNISGDNIMGTVKELVSQKYDGRKPGTQGNQLATEYISAYFKQIGLENPKGLENYMQYYTQPVIDLTAASELKLFDKSGKLIMPFKYGDNFVLRVMNKDKTKLDIKAPLLSIESSSMLDDTKAIKGKLLMVSADVRSSMNFNSLLEKAHKGGAVGVIGEFNSKGPGRTYGDLPVTPMIGPWLEKSSVPFIYVDNESFEKFVSAAKLEGQAELSCSYTIKDSKVANIVGLISGSDPKLKDEYIIVGAHFDHVGDNADGTYNPGGLDNASGTSAMLELARLIKANKVAPKKSILFIAFNGEEGGMIGSKYYAENPIYPLDKAVMINLDMVGASAKDVVLSICGAEGQRADLRNEVYEMAQTLHIKSAKDLEGSSDHASFAEKGVQAVCIINLDFQNGYHSKYDTADDVSKDRITEVARLVLYYIDKKAY